MGERYPLGEHTSLELLAGDITALEVDAIVNAANRRMLGGGGVDGAIHRAAGPELREACAEVAEIEPGVRCPTGQARITPGFGLRARYVIHTVGPVYRGPASARLLESAYRSSLKLGREHGLHSIAFPAIPCGVYCYPLGEAADSALRTCQAPCAGLARLVFALFDPAAQRAFAAAAQALFAT